MFLSRLQVFIFSKMLNIVLPILILLGLFQFSGSNLIDNVVYIFFVGNFIFLLFKVAPWELTNYYTRYMLVFIYLIISVRNIVIVDNSLNTRVFTDTLILVFSLILLYLNFRLC